MPSPSRPLRGSPPRRALHERTESQTNERSLRMIGDPQAPIYGSPFPTKPSQILSPRGQGLNVHDEPGAPHGRNSPYEASQPVQVSPKGTGPQKSENHPQTRNPDATWTELSSTTDHPLHISPASTPVPGLPAIKQPAEDDARGSEEIVQLPSVPLRKALPGSHAVDLSNPHECQFVQTNESESSLSSTNSTGTVIVKKNRDGKKRASYFAFPNILRPSSSKSSSSPSTSHDGTPAEWSEHRIAPSSMTPSSTVLPPLPVSADRRVSSSPLSTDLQTASQKLVDFQYPIIRPPSASASWVQPANSAGGESERRIERDRERWNPHLSTVQSEATGLQSEGRSSQTMWLPDSSRVSKSSFMAFNGRASADLPLNSNTTLPQTSSNPSALPNPPAVHRRDFTGSTIRIVTEQEDTLPTLQQIPGSRGSEHLGPASLAHRHRNHAVPRPSSRASFFRDSIPAWAKLYYARPQSSSSNIFRPKTRNNQEPNGQERGDLLAINPIRPRAIDLTEVRGPPGGRASLNWSPHLWHDRTSLGRRRTVFQMPIIDGRAEGKAPSKRNAQILLFVFGFVFPPAWFLGSFMPLPAKPNMSKLKGKDDSSRAQVVEDLEKRLDPIDEARYENARWWRNINRILSLFGVVIVVAVITIAAVTAT